MVSHHRITADRSKSPTLTITSGSVHVYSQKHARPGGASDGLFARLERLGELLLHDLRVPRRLERLRHIARVLGALGARLLGRHRLAQLLEVILERELARIDLGGWQTGSAAYLINE